ncbi:hypothetical protein ACHAWF_009946 [Thalassiosira exigua]
MEFMERLPDSKKMVKKQHINMTYAKPECKNQISRVDREIRDLKRRGHDNMRKKNVPERLWDFGLVYTAKIMQILPRLQLRDRAALEAVTGKTPGISEFCDFDFYDLVWYHPGVHPSISQQNREVGWLIPHGDEAHHRPEWGKAHSNPMLDTRVYEVQFEDGTHDCLMANKIAENLYAQVDDDDREILRFADIIDHHKDPTALTKDNGFIKVQGDGSKCIKTTKGWGLLMERKDDTSLWLPLRDVKEARHIQLAEYAIAMGLDREPAFMCWVDYVLKKRGRIIKKAKSKYWRTTHEYAIRVPKTTEEALRIDKETGTTF